MVSDQQANYIINISLHVLILFTFLTIFFFAYISRLEKKSVDDALLDAINGQVDTVLTGIDNHMPPLKIEWEILNKLGEDIQKESKGALPAIISNHRNLRNIAVAMIVGLFCILVGLYVYFLSIGININWKRIITENMIIFIFVGIIEFLFFTKVASKYIPVTPDLLSKTILERLKYHFFEYMDKK